MEPTASVARHETFSHQADVGVRGLGATPAEAFEQAALALTTVVTDHRVREERAVELEASSPDLEVLVYLFLNAVVRRMAVEGMLFARYEVSIEGDSLRARAHGERVDPRRHEPAVEPKGATFTELAVREDAPGRWRAQCVVDV